MGGDFTQGAQRSKMFGADGGCAGKPLLEGGEDLDPFDGIDAEIGIHPHVEFQHLNRIAGLLAHYGKERFGDLCATCLNGRRKGDCCHRRDGDAG